MSHTVADYYQIEKRDSHKIVEEKIIYVSQNY